MSQVIYSALREKYPDLIIHVLAPSTTLPLITRMPEVDRGILIDQSHGELGLAYRFRLGSRLKKNNYDWSIVTPNSFKAALVPLIAGAQLRTGFLGEYRYLLLNDIKLLDKSQLPLMTDRFRALVNDNSSEMISPRLTVDKEAQLAFLNNHGLSTDKPIVGFCPGAEFGDAKKWPEEHYAELASLLIKRGYSVWIMGSSTDLFIGDVIASGAGDGCVYLAGNTTIPEAIDLLALCQSVVTNDSGLMHVAAAVGTKVIAIYGSTSPEFTPPIIENSQTLSLELGCSPCFKRICPLGHKNCLNLLMPEQVLEYI